MGAGSVVKVGDLTSVGSSIGDLIVPDARKGVSIDVTGTFSGHLVVERSFSEAPATFYPVDYIDGRGVVAPAVTALNGLASAAYWKSASQDFNRASGGLVRVEVTLVTADSGAGSATGYANVLLAGSMLGVLFDGNITAGDAAWSSAAPTTAVYARSLRAVGRIPLETTNTATYTYQASFDLQHPPKYGVFVIENGSGKALAAEGNAVRWYVAGGGAMARTIWTVEEGERYRVTASGPFSGTASVRIAMRTW